MRAAFSASEAALPMLRRHMKRLPRRSLQALFGVMPVNNHGL
jgi:hypothetical protein